MADRRTALASALLEVAALHRRIAEVCEHVATPGAADEADLAGPIDPAGAPSELDQARARAALKRLSLPEGGQCDGQWVSQKESPLGRAKHLALVRGGALQGYKVGRQVFVKRDEIHAYIQKHRLARKMAPSTPERDEIDRELQRLGFGADGEGNGT